MYLLYLLLLILLLIFSYVVYFIIYVPLKIQAHFRSKEVKGPRYCPIIGNTSEIRRLFAAVQTHRLPSPDHDVLHLILPFYSAWSLKYGKIFLYWFGWQPRLAISHPETIKHVLLSTGGPSFNTRSLNHSSRLLFGQGLVGLRGEKWSLHRRIISPAFNIERVKAWVPEIAAITVKMVQKWEEEGGRRTTFEKEVVEEFNDLSAEVISRIVFGSSCAEGKRIFELQQELMLLTTQSFRSVSIPGFSSLPTPKNRQRWRMDREITHLIRKLMGKESAENERNLLSQLMAEKMKEEDIVNECKTFYFAGRETTANLLSWVVFCLAVHQDWQEKAREEALCVLPETEFPSGGVVSDLKILGLIINETLRLYPPAVMLLRRVTKGTQLGDLHVPAGTELYLPISAVHRDPELWGADASSFNPARFSHQRTHMAAFAPFGLGPRICVGQSLAIVETKIVVAIILKHYSLMISPTYVHSPLPLLTLKPNYGMQVVFSKLPS